MKAPLTAPVAIPNPATSAARRVSQPPPVPIPVVDTVAPGTPAPAEAKVSRVLVSALFFGPFGAIAGTGVGLLVSGVLGDFKRKDDRPS